MNIRLKMRIYQKYGSQSDFSMAVGERESLVSRVIRGRRALAAEKQQEWAKALDCKPDEIFNSVVEA